MTPKEITTLAGHRLVPPWVMKLVLEATAIERKRCVQVCDEICTKAMESGYTTKGETFIDGFGDGACACSCAIRGLK